MLLRRQFSTSCNRYSNNFTSVLICPGQGKIDSDLFVLPRYEIQQRTQLSAEIKNILKSVSGLLPDQRILNFFDPKISPHGPLLDIQSINTISNHPDLKLLESTAFVQPLVVLATFLNYFVAHRTFNWSPVDSNYMIGHSLGELTTLALQDVISLEGAIRIAVQRGRLMEDVILNSQKEWGAVAILARDTSLLLKILDKMHCNIATVNTGQVVVSGTKSELKLLLNKLDSFSSNLAENGLSSAKFRKIWLPITTPVHHHIFKNLEHELSDIVMDEWASYGSKKLQVPIVCGVNGLVVQKGTDRVINNWVTGMTRPVRFDLCVQKVYEEHTQNPQNKSTDSENKFTDNENNSVDIQKDKAKAKEGTLDLLNVSGVTYNLCRAATKGMKNVKCWNFVDDYINTKSASKNDTI